jgi:uncharacterized protein
MIHLSWMIAQTYRLWRGVIVAFCLIMLASGFWLTPAYATGVYDLPTIQPGDRPLVIDQADVLSKLTEGKINETLNKLAETTGKEVRFVTVRRLDYEETASSLATKLFQRWFATSEAGENQVLLLLDSLTNQDAIQVGKGVESLITPAIAESIVAESVLIPLRQGDKYNEALSDTSDRLFAIMTGAEDPGPPQIAENLQVESNFKTAEETDTKNSAILVLVLLLVATVVPMVTYFWYQRSPG